MLDGILKSKIEAFGKVMGLQANAYDKESNSFETLTFEIANDLIIKVLQNSEVLTKILNINEVGKLFLLEDSNNLSFLVVNLSEQNLSVSFGPFFKGNKDPEPLIRACEKQSGSKLSENSIKNILSAIPIKDDSFIEAWKILVCLMFSLESNTEITTYKESETNKDSEKKTFILSQMSNNRISEKHISEGYLFEQQIRQAIVKADKARLQELLVPKNQDALRKASEVYGQTTRDRLGANRLRYEKNITVILNTIFRLTAESTGLPPIYLHSISDKVAKSIEASHNQEEIIEIISQMINTYCDAITRLNLENHSYRIIRVQKYIITNLTEDLTLEQLASVAETSPQHLSRLFKKECGMTITDYIRKQKIGEAKWMLQSSDNPIYEIAEALGFSSQNYFCNVFRKETGMTPSEFKSFSENQII